jgi:xylulokinase
LVTDRSDASGTAYWSPATSEYDREMLILALGHDAILPRVLGPAESVPGDGFIVGAGAGDNAASGLGLDMHPGDVAVSLGTSGTVFAATGQRTRELTGTVAGFADATGGFLPLVCTYNAARILDAMNKVIGTNHEELGLLALAAQPGAGGVVLVPYFEGERTPNLPDARATLSGLSLANTCRENFARAAVEGMLCGLADGVDAIRELGVGVERVLIVGGAAVNPAVQQIAAQVFDVPVFIPEPGEYVANGAARQAAWALTGQRPTWPVELIASLDPDPQPRIREQYALAQKPYFA